VAYDDHFSGCAGWYARFRPDYPHALFRFVASLGARRRVAWDCATGNGQAAAGLAQLFDRVIATDASAEQIQRARPHARVEYRIALAESSGLPSACVDVVTVAQALHWLDVARFAREVKRVVRPGGAIVAWSYGEGRLDTPELDAVWRSLLRGTLGPYWPRERAYVWSEYRTLPFPFPELPAPRLAMERSWTLPELVGYVRSWSAVARYTAARGEDPVPALAADLGRVWGDPASPHVLRWPLVVRAGRV
jgi:SAM-dependent methyltransferase